MVARSEAFSRNRGHMRFAQQPSGHVGRGLHAAASEERRDIRIGIERSFRHRARDARESRAGHSPRDRAAGCIRAASRSTHSCGPFSAATAAFCTIEVGFDVDWLCSFCIALITAAGASA